MKTIVLNKYAGIILGIFLIMFLWWVWITAHHFQDTTQNYVYGAALGVLPIFGAIFGFIHAKNWGWFSSAMGKSVTYLSVGLLSWGIGTIVFAYYNIFQQVAVPYPSMADALYIISWPLWVISMFYLSKATGFRFQVSNNRGRSLLFIIPIVTIILSYYVLIIVAREGVISSSVGGLKVFFDLAYPIGDVVILTTALLIYGLSFNSLGGFFKWPIVIVLAGFVLNYVGDSAFVYATTKGTYFVADHIDLVYTIAFFLLSFGLSLMDPNLFSEQTSLEKSV